MADGSKSSPLIGAWLFLIALGAATTGLLRAPIESRVNFALLAFNTHRWLGAGLCIVTVAYLVRRSRRGSLIAAGLILGVGAFGWWSARLLAPRPVAIHAALAAFATVAVAGMSRGAAGSPPRPLVSAGKRRWLIVAARLAFGLMLLQVAIGAFLRHQLIGLVWHLLVGGAAVLALLVPAISVLHDDAAGQAEQRAARWAITAVLVQVSLGVTVFFMILLGTPPLTLWLSTTIAHVTMGTLTLLATAEFNRRLESA